MAYTIMIYIYIYFMLLYRIDNQCEVVMAAVPITRLEKVLNQFDDEGYEPGVAANNQEQKGIWHKQQTRVHACGRFCVRMHACVRTHHHHPHTYIPTHRNKHIHIYMYIFRERERDRDREKRDFPIFFLDNLSFINYT